MGKQIVRILYVLGLLVVAAAPSTAGSRSGRCTPREECCKICDEGKACGNSCIRRSYNCHKGVGCACDAESVCE